MDDLEAALQDWGRKWRAGQAPVDRIHLQPTQLERGDRRPVRWSTMALAGLATIGVLSFVLARLGPNTSAGWLREGASVVGTGLLSEGSGRVHLCIGGYGRGDEAPSCSAVAVPVDAVRWNTVPGATHADSGWYADNVTVRGSWIGSSLHAESVTSNPHARYIAPQNPCHADEGSGIGLGTPAEEEALGILGSEVFAHPEAYAGLWRAASRDNLGRVVVEVVGERGAVETKLRARYPYPLCVVTADFSEVALNTTLDRLGASTADWLARVDYPENRVIVSVAVLTDAIQVQLDPFAGQIVVTQLLQPG